VEGCFLARTATFWKKPMSKRQAGTKRPRTTPEQEQTEKKEKKAKKQKKPKKSFPSVEEQKTWIGKIFACHHCYSSPSVVQIVGFTKARVRVRDVKLKVHHNTEPSGGGSAELNLEWLRTHPITKLVSSNTSYETMAWNPDEDGDGHGPGLSLKEDYYIYHEVDYMKEDASAGHWIWCEY